MLTIIARMLHSREVAYSQRYYVKFCPPPPRGMKSMHEKLRRILKNEIINRDLHDL